MNFFKTCASASTNPVEVYNWVFEVDKVRYEELERNDNRYMTLNSKIATELARIIYGEFQRKIIILEEKMLKDPGGAKLLSGRQLAWMIFENFKTANEYNGLMDVTDLLKVKLRGDNLLAFRNDMDSALQNQRKEPDEDTKIAIYKRAMDDSPQLKETMAALTFE